MKHYCINIRYNLLSMKRNRNVDKKGENWSIVFNIFENLTNAYIRRENTFPICAGLYLDWFLDWLHVKAINKYAYI